MFLDGRPLRQGRHSGWLAAGSKMIARPAARIGFLQFSVAICFGIAMLSANAHATVFIPPSGCTILTFTKGSANLTNEHRVQLARLWSHFESLEGSVVWIHAWGDKLRSFPKDFGKQDALAGRRAEVLRDFFLARGMKVASYAGEWARFTPVSGASGREEGGIDSINRSFKSTAGIAVVNYVGTCRSGYQGICNQIPKTCEIQVN